MHFCFGEWDVERLLQEWLRLRQCDPLLPFGLKINFRKGKIMSVGSVSYLDEIADIMGCEISSLPSSYHDLPLRAKYRFKAIWSPML